MMTENAKGVKNEPIVNNGVKIEARIWIPFAGYQAVEVSPTGREKGGVFANSGSISR